MGFLYVLCDLRSTPNTYLYLQIPSLERTHAALPKKDHVGEATSSTANRMGSETDHRPKQGSRQVQKLDSKILDNSLTQTTRT